MPAARTKALSDPRDIIIHELLTFLTQNAAASLDTVDTGFLSIALDIMSAIRSSYVMPLCAAKDG